MALYETILIARQDVTSSQVEGLTETFSKILTDNGGKIAKTEQWGLKTLNYRIKKNRKGHYVYIAYEAPSAAVNEMERNMSISEDVLRYMTVRIEAIEEGPTAMLSNKGDRGERGERGSERGERGDRGPRRFDGPRGGGFGDRGDRGPRRERGAEGEGDRA